MSRKISIVLFFVVALNNFSTAQNLVLNPNMEDTTAVFPLPSGIWQSCGPCYTPPWFQPYPGSSDYFNYIFWVNHTIPTPTFPNYYDLWPGYQLSNSGFGMIGFVGFVQTSTNHREYVEGVLSDTLIAGHNYCISMFVSLSNHSGRAIANLGLKFYNDSVLTPYNLFSGQTPDVESSQLITDTLNWVEVSGTYTAQGGEKYFIIGNLRTDSATTVVVVTPEPGGGGGMDQAAYYYIDDVSVTDCTVGLEEQNDIAQLQFSPNPTSGEIDFDLKISQQSVAEVLDITGRLVLKQEMEPGGKRHNVDMKALPGGVYLVRVLEGGRPLAAGRVVKM